MDLNKKLVGTFFMENSGKGRIEILKELPLEDGEKIRIRINNKD